MEKDDHTLLSLKNGTIVRLYVGTTSVNRQVDKPVLKKPKFTWDYVDPKKTKTPTVRLPANRKSIFQDQ